MPSNQPQKIKDRNTTIGDKPSPLPCNLGSMTWPRPIFTPKYTRVVSPADPNPNSKNAKIIAGSPAKTEPSVGI